MPNFAPHNRKSKNFGHIGSLPEAQSEHHLHFPKKNCPSRHTRKADRKTCGDYLNFLTYKIYDDYLEPAIFQKMKIQKDWLY